MPKISDNMRRRVGQRSSATRAPAQNGSGNATGPSPETGAGNYPPDWPQIAQRIKDAAGWICERCKHPHDLPSGHVLTVHHLDGNKSNCADWNLAALCQRCHLRVQGRVKMDQLFFVEILDVAEWFKPHLAGFLVAKKIAGTATSRRYERSNDDENISGTTAHDNTKIETAHAVAATAAAAAVPG
jgi:hypothetical protein